MNAGIYGVVYSSISRNIISSTGEEYNVSVYYDAQKAGIPKGAELEVREIKAGTTEYEGYFAAASDGLDGRIIDAGFLDIEILFNGEKIEPATPVKVVIKKLGPVPEGTVNILHFTENTPIGEPLLEDALVTGFEEQTLVETELEQELPRIEHLKTDSVNGDTITFTANSFTVYAVLYTVDFEYEGRILHFPGQGSYKLANVLSELGVEGSIEKAELRLIAGEDHPGALYLEEKADGWYISSDIAFTDIYELKVVVDGIEYVITVTDAQDTLTTTIKFLQKMLRFLERMRIPVTLQCTLREIWKILTIRN